eukprot:7720707-Prorocentrum_lima.AAC.1
MKQQTKLITYREPGSGFDAPHCRGRYETLDWAILSHRWFNIVKDVESDFQADIDSGHRPLLVSFRYNLK